MKKRLRENRYFLLSCAWLVMASLIVVGILEVTAATAAMIGCFAMAELYQARHERRRGA